MRGTRAKRERKLGLRSGPATREQRASTVKPSDVVWRRDRPLPPDEVAETRAEEKRARRRARNLAWELT